MSKEDTIRMARESGAIHIHKNPKEFALVGNEAIGRFAELVRADEREACAKVCDALLKADGNWTPTSHRFAAAIRARSNT